MKFVIIPYIALGFVLSLTIGVVYNCEGNEISPKYYGSPFIFKQESLGSSMEYYYNLFGLILNTLIWSVFIFLADKMIKKISESKIFNAGYKVIIYLLIVFSTLNILIDSMLISQGYNIDLNYWYWDTNKEVEEWGLTYERELIIFGKENHQKANF